MTTEPAPAGVPEFDLADRMRKALRTSGVGVQEIADYLGVARNTVSTWINGRIEPNRQTIRLWAMRTGVSFEWLESGGYGQSPTRPTTTGYSHDFNTLSDFFSGGNELTSLPHDAATGALRTTRVAA
jgi:transcriptional regulator with XRE-family HTH domain